MKYKVGNIYYYKRGVRDFTFTVIEIKGEGIEIKILTDKKRPGGLVGKDYLLYKSSTMFKNSVDITSDLAKAIFL